MSRLQERAPWLAVDEPQLRELPATHDDAFDALIAAMIARAAALGLTIEPGSEERARTRAEGSIAIPDEDSFDRLSAG